MRRYKQNFFLVSFFVLFSLSNLFSRDQNLDSLYSQLKGAKTTESLLSHRLDFLLSLKSQGVNSWNEISDNGIIDLIYESLTDSAQIEKVGQQWNKIARDFRRKGHYDLAFLFHDYACQLYLIKNQTQNLPETYNGMGVVFRRLDICTRAMEYHLKAFSISRKINDTVSEAIACNGLGNVFFMTDQFDKAEEQFSRALELQKVKASLRGIAINYNNLSNVYRKKGDHKRALDLLNLSFDANIKMNDKKGLAICFRNKARLLMANELEINFQKAESYFLKSLKLHEEIKDERGLASAYLGLAELMIKKKDFIQGGQYLDSALITSQSVRALSRLAEIYVVKKQLAQHQGQFNDALAFLEMSERYKDSMLLSNTKLGIFQLLRKLEHKDHIRLVETLNFEKSQIEGKRHFLFLINALSILVILLLIVFLGKRQLDINKVRRKRRDLEKIKNKLESSQADLINAKSQSEEANKIKTKFLSGVSHEIRTPLNSIMGFAKLLQDIVPEEIKDQHVYLTSIQESGDTLLKLVGSILDITNLEEKEINTNTQAFFISEAITQVKEDLRPIFNEKALELSIEISPHIPTRIMLNENFFVQLLYNLLVLVSGQAYRKNTINLKMEGEFDGGRFNPLVQIQFRGNSTHVWSKAKGSISEDFEGLNVLLLRRLGQLVGAEINQNAFFDNMQLIQLKFPPCEMETLSAESFVPSYRFPHISFGKNRIILLADDYERYAPLRKYLTSCDFVVFQMAYNSKILAQIERFKPNVVLTVLGDPSNTEKLFLENVKQLCELKQIHFAGCIQQESIQVVNQISYQALFDLLLTEPLDLSDLFDFLIQQGLNSSESAVVEEENILKMHSFEWPENITMLLNQLKTSTSIALYQELANALIEFGLRQEDPIIGDLGLELQFSCDTFDIAEMMKQVDYLVSLAEETVEPVLDKV